MKNIFITLPSGIAIRNFLTTDIINNLLKDDREVFIHFFLADPDFYKEYLVHDRVSFKKISLPSKTIFSSILRASLYRRFHLINDNATSKILRKKQIITNLKTKFLPLFGWPFPKSKKLYHYLRKKFYSLYTSEISVNRYFDQLNPELLISTHPTSVYEINYTSVAQKRGVPIMGVVKSFDNITSKGFLPVVPSFFSVWNQQMKEELVHIHAIDPINISINGAPQFDNYLNYSPKSSFSQFTQAFGLSGKRKIVLLTTTSEDINSSEPSLADFLYELSKNLNFDLLVRPHPADDNNERFKNQISKGIAFQSFSKHKDLQKKISMPNFISDLSETLFYTDILINTASTTTLDAAIMNIPIINIAFNIDDHKRDDDISRYYKLDHFKKITSSNASSIVHNQTELTKSIEMYLDDPFYKADLRSKLKKDFIGFTGNASKNLSGQIIRFLEK